MKIKVNKRRWYWAVGLISGVLTLLAMAALAAALWVSHQLPALDAARRWRGESETRFTQIGCFLPEGGYIQEDSIWQFHQTLDQKLVDASLTPPENGSLYQDAYSGMAEVSVQALHGTAKAKAIGVGGDFFLFHPLELRSGNYLLPDDFMQDRVLLDTELAWQLFGGYDVTGMTVDINGHTCYVAGVVYREKDFASQKAYQDGPGLFMSYSAFHALTEKDISCYEIVLPDPISGFGLSLMRENFQVGTGDLVENTRRYGIKNLLTVARDFGVRSMRTNGVIYPYWENAARLTEDYAALLAVLAVLFGIPPVIILLVLGIRGLVGGSRYATRQIPKQVDQMVEKRREKRYRKEHGSNGG